MNYYEISTNISLYLPYWLQILLSLIFAIALIFIPFIKEGLMQILPQPMDEKNKVKHFFFKEWLILISFWSISAFLSFGVYSYFINQNVEPRFAMDNLGHFGGAYFIMQGLRLFIFLTRKSMQSVKNEN